ncbi:MAG: hypothetical protein WD552_02805 [Candidatus Paceibacterota bacterium]
MKLFSPFKKTLDEKSSHLPGQGFLLMEMLVAISVVLIFMTIAINERDDFARSVSLDNVAHEVALTIRQAQSYGISSQGSDIGDDVYDFSYGVYFNLDSLPGAFRLVRYSTGSAGGDPNQEEVINEYQLPSHIHLAEFCTFDSDIESASCDDEGSGIVVFTRPNPDARFFTANGNNQIDTNNIAVVLENDEGRKRTVVVNLTGYIYVE